MIDCDCLNDTSDDEDDDEDDGDDDDDDDHDDEDDGKDDDEDDDHDDDDDGDSMCRCIEAYKVRWLLQLVTIGFSPYFESCPVNSNISMRR